MAYGKGANGIASWKGYSANVQLPAKTKCKRCGKSKSATEAHFSNKQIEALKEYISRNPGRFDEKVTEAIICKMCTGGPITELECHGCNRMLGINKFNKTQRRTPDVARCDDCQHERNNYEFGGDQEGSSDSDTTTTTDIGHLSLHDLTSPSTANNSSRGGVSVNGSSRSSTQVPRPKDHATAPHLRYQSASGSSSIASSSYASSDAGSAATTIPTRSNPGVNLGTLAKSSGTSTTPRTVSNSRFAKPFNPGPKREPTSYRDSNKEVMATSDSDSEELDTY